MFDRNLTLHTCLLPPQACPCCLQAGSWPELARRYFALAATAALVRSTEASGGLDTALGHQHAGCTPLAALGPLVIQQVSPVPAFIVISCQPLWPSCN